MASAPIQCCSPATRMTSSGQTSPGAYRRFHSCAQSPCKGLYRRRMPRSRRINQRTAPWQSAQGPSKRSTHSGLGLESMGLHPSTDVLAILNDVDACGPMFGGNVQVFFRGAYPKDLPLSVDDVKVPASSVYPETLLSRIGVEADRFCRALVEEGPFG